MDQIKGLLQNFWNLKKYKSRRVQLLKHDYNNQNESTSSNKWQYDTYKKNLLVIQKIQASGNLLIENN